MNKNNGFKNSNSQNIIKNSMTFYIYSNVKKILFNAPAIKYFFNPYKLTPLWRSSFLFKQTEKILKHLPLLKYKANISFEHIAGCSILISTFTSIFPKFGGLLCNALILFWSYAYLQKNKSLPSAVSFTAILILFISFYIIYCISFKNGFILAIKLLLPPLFFITASFSLNSNSRINIIDSYCAISLIILTSITICIRLLDFNIIPNLNKTANVTVLLMPLSILEGLHKENNFKKTVYIAITTTLSACTVILNGSSGCHISYFTAMLIMILLIKPKLIIYVLLFTPAIIKYVANYLINSLHRQIKYETPIENIISVSRNLWSNALGIGYKPFLNAYNSLTSSKPYANTFMFSYINESYLKFLYNISFLLLFILLWFSLKAIRSCVPNIFNSSSKKRTISVCRLTFLVSASVIAFMSSDLTDLSVASLYWIILASIIAANPKFGRI